MKKTSYIIRIAILILLFSGIMDLYLWINNSYLIPSYVVTAFTISTSMLLLVVDKYIRDEK